MHLFQIDKIATVLASPLAIGIVVLFYAGCVRKRAQRSVCWTACVILLFCSSGAGSQLLVRSLESKFTRTGVAAAPNRDAIVVLGGYLREDTAIGRPVELGGASDRLWCGAQLYRAGKAPLILLTGGNLHASVPEAILAGRILQNWGIPENAILTEGKSLDTHENAKFSMAILGPRGFTHILLVTSATHMTRASATFEKAGFTVTPVAADFLTGRYDSVLLTLLPQAGALGNFELAFKEWLGLAVYRLRKWAV